MDDTTKRDNGYNAPHNSAEKDRVAGGFQEAKGRMKEGMGAFTGNEEIKAEGQGEQFSGRARNKKGQWKARIKSWIDRF